MTTPSERVRARRETLSCAGLLLLGVLAYLLLPGGPLRAALVLPTVLWVPGRCLVVRLGLVRLAGFWAVPLSVLLSIATLVLTALVVYAVNGRVAFGPMALWTALAALQLIAWRRYRRLSRVPEQEPAAEPAHARAAEWRPSHPVLSGAGLLLGGGAAAVVLTAVYHVLPAQKQPGYLAFAYAPGFAALSGVVDATAGQRLTVPFTVTAAQQDTNGLTVVASLDGARVAPPAEVAVVHTGPAPRAADGSTDAHDAEGAARLAVTVPAGCLSRFTFTLERAGTALRTLDLYVTTDRLAGACAT
jgi:hypothetical protein